MTRRPAAGAPTPSKRVAIYTRKSTTMGLEQEFTFGVDDFTIPQYIDWVVANARRFEEVELVITGATPDEKSAALVSEMLRVGVAV